ncbi:hypothetical protein CXB51_010820 [Gossypium anomalum]|uniref:Uncharacterized protein n=1 Tax=Gossypium anomalum TaxID=47600 RepID=A0A8J5YNE3_9ROSI|nr:hypothetical protein CXB51_010820 [Gossypium anomalum]
MLIHEGVEQSVQEVSTFVQSYVHELAMLMERSISHQQPLAERWSVPQTPFTKVNFDAGFSRENQESTTRVVIRNHQGLVNGSYTHFKRNISDPCSAEAMSWPYSLLEIWVFAM